MYLYIYIFIYAYICAYTEDNSGLSDSHHGRGSAGDAPRQHFAKHGSERQRRNSAAVGGHHREELSYAGVCHWKFI